MASSAESKSSYRPASTFLTLFRLAYNRIWKSRALRGWEMFWWLICVTWLVSRLHGYQLIFLNPFLFLIVWGCLIILTPILVATWVNAALVTTGFNDDALRIIPIGPFNLLWPKLMAVFLTWFQFFLPLLFIFAGLAKYRPLTFEMETTITPGMIFLAFAELVGWMALWSSWGFLCGSHSKGNTVAYMVQYYLSPAIQVICILGIFKLTGGTTNFLQLILATTRILPDWLELIGSAGLLLWFLIMVLACSVWGRRK